jgi:pyruvate ferredoxin oxidoreductase beta subunit
MKKINTVKDVSREELLTGGTYACAGCNAILGLKLALKALGRKTIVVISSGCMTLTASDGFTPYKVPWVHNAIENMAATGTGILAGLKAQKKEKGINILCYAGDGATYDIGLQSLSGMATRYDNILYVCYNNSAYANTGFQNSSATPVGARTTTTPPAKKEPMGNSLPRKNMAKIMAAHNIPYVATACTAFPLDYMRKLQKAAKIKGPKFIDLLTPCIPGWYIGDDEGVETGKLMVNTGMWPLYEVENKQFRLTYTPRPRMPVEKALSQGRYRHLKPRHIKIIQQIVDEEWKLLEAGRFWEAVEY